MSINNELYKDLNNRFANKNPNDMDQSYKQAYFDIIKEIAKELKKNENPNTDEYAVLLKVSTGTYKDLFVSALKNLPQEDRESFVQDLQRVNNAHHEEQQHQQMINTLADMLKSVPARLAAIENIETNIKEDKLNPVIKNLMVEMLKDEDIKEQLDAEKLVAILKIGQELSESNEDSQSLSAQFIDKLIAETIIDENTENKLLDISIKTEQNETQIIADDTARKQQEEAERLAREEQERLDKEAKEEAENKAAALNELEEKTKDENLNPIIKDFFGALLKDDKIKQNLSSQEITGLIALDQIDKDNYWLDTINNVSMTISTNITDETSSDLYYILSDIEKPLLLKELEEKANSEDTHTIVKEFFDTLLKDEELKNNLSNQDIRNISTLGGIDKNDNDFDVIQQIKFNLACDSSSQTDKLLDIITNIEEVHTSTEQERQDVLKTLNQFHYDNPPKIKAQTAQSLLTCNDPEMALMNIADLYAVGQTIKDSGGKLSADAIDSFQDVLKSRLANLTANLKDGEINPSDAKAYLDLCDQCKDANLAASARSAIADALVKYDKKHFGALNPDSDDLAAVYNYANQTLEKIDPFALPAERNEPDLSKLEILDDQGKSLNNKQTQDLKKRLAEMAREMTAREVVARKGNISSDELNQIYKASVAQILENAKPDPDKLNNEKRFSVKATDLAHSLAVQTNKMEEFNFRAKQKFKNHPWVKALTSSLDKIDKKLEANKTIGKAYKIAKPVVKFLGKTAFSSAKTAAIFGVAGLVPGGTGIVLAYYGGKNIKQAVDAIHDKNLSWKQKAGKLIYHSVSATLSLVGAAQGLEVGSGMLKNAGFEGLGNVLHGAGNIINQGLGQFGHGVTALVAKTANLLPGVQGLHGVSSEAITSTLNSITPYGRFAIMGGMMTAPNIGRGIVMKCKSSWLKHKIKKEKDPLKLQALILKQQSLHDYQIENLKDMTLKLGSSAIGMFISSKLTPLVGNLIHGTASVAITEAKEAIEEINHSGQTAKVVEISFDGESTQIQKTEQPLSQAEQQQQGQSEAQKGHMATPREDPETTQTTQHKTTTTHNAAHTGTHAGGTTMQATVTTVETGDAANSSPTAGTDATITTAEAAPTQTTSGSNAADATLNALKAAGIQGVEITYDDNGAPSVQIIHTENAPATSDPTAASAPTSETTLTSDPTDAPAPQTKTVMMMDEATGEMVEREVPVETQTTKVTNGTTGDVEEPTDGTTTTTPQVTEDDNSATSTQTQQPTATQEKYMKVLGFDGKEIAIPAGRADAPASISLYQGYDEVNGYNLNHATSDGMLTPAVYNELKAQGIVTVDQLCQYIENHPDALTQTTTTTASQTTVSLTASAATNTTVNVSTQGTPAGTTPETMTQTITLPDGSTAERVAPTNRSTVTIDGSSTEFSTRANVELTGDTVVDYLNLTEARDGNNGSGSPQGYHFEPVNQPQQPQEQVVVDQPQFEPQAAEVPVIVFDNPMDEEAYLMERGYVHAQGLNHNLRNDAAICVLEPAFSDPRSPAMCIVIEPEPHVDEQTGQLTFCREVLKAELEGQIRGSCGDAGYYTEDRRFSHNIHDVHGIGVPVHAPTVVDRVFHTIDSGIRLVGTGVNLVHSVTNLFSGGHHHGHDAPPPPPHSHRGR